MGQLEVGPASALLDIGLGDVKAQLLAAIVHGTETGGLMNQPAFLTAIGIPDDWIVRAANNPGSVPLVEFVQVYAAAADQAGWHSLTDILKLLTLMRDIGSGRQNEKSASN